MGSSQQRANRRNNDRNRAILVDRLKRAHRLMEERREKGNAIDLKTALALVARREDSTKRPGVVFRQGGATYRTAPDGSRRKL